jgi:Tfp pilus assembly protein PilF
MRFTPPTLALAALFAVVSSVGVTKAPDSQIDPVSLAWAAKGDAARNAGDLDAANDAYESALAVDPRNRASPDRSAQRSRKRF